MELCIAPGEDSKRYSVKLVIVTRDHPLRCEIYMRTAGPDYHFDDAQFERYGS